MMISQQIKQQLMAELLGAARSKNPATDTSTVAIEGAQVTATSPEGKAATMPLEEFLDKISPRRIDTGEAVLPDGIKAARTQGPITVWVYEMAPAVHSFKWIRSDSPVPFGPGTEYRIVRLAIPYLVMLVVFATDGSGSLHLTSANECFFRVAPLKSLDDPLHYPALLNCSRFEPQEGRPLSWICSQHLRPAKRESDQGKRLTASFDSLRHCLLETGFNLSSEHHEFSSWFTESTKVDARIRTVEAWEQATTENPLFVLDVPWIPTNHSVRQVVDRILKNQANCVRRLRSAAALASIVFNHGKAPPKNLPESSLQTLTEVFEALS